MTTRKTPAGGLESIQSKRRKFQSVERPQHPEEPTPEFPHAKSVWPDSFETVNHYYEKVLNATLHPLVAHFQKMGNERIAKRYCHLNPTVDRGALLEMLNTTPKHFRWAGADLFSVTTEDGRRQMIVCETNSCPSGQKSFPSPPNASHDADGYHQMMRDVFKPMVDERAKEGTLESGVLAVICDKNPMEATGYAGAMASTFKERVYFTKMYKDETNPAWKWVEDVLNIRDAEGKWHPVRACFRYVTQAPWTRIPTNSKTVVLNPIVCCLAGGRNKMAADKAYQFFNSSHRKTGLKLRTPVTIRDVPKMAVAMHVRSMGGIAVVKNPYSNAGQGVYTICSDEELQAFLKEKHHYDKFIVQSLVGNYEWSSTCAEGKFFHTGTIPDRKNRSFVSDLRCMVLGTDKGWRPCALYSRRALKAIKTTPSTDSWEMLGTNLSIKKEDGGWGSDTSRLLLMDTKDFNMLGMGLDDLIDGYIQTVMAACSIDQLCSDLIKNGKFNWKLYMTLNHDESLFREILVSVSEGKTVRLSDLAAAAGAAPPS